MVQEKITGIILSGGKSSRLGEEKGLALFNSKPLVQYALETLETLCDTIIISANQQFEAYSIFGHEIVKDKLKGIGPMGGLMACLEKSTTRYNFILSCDTPFVPPDLFKHLLHNIENFQAAVPTHDDGRIEPLCAVYATNLIWQMQHQVETGNYKLHHFLEEAKTKYVSIHPELPFYDDEIFVNMNTRSDILNNSWNG